MCFLLPPPSAPPGPPPHLREQGLQASFLLPPPSHCQRLSRKPSMPTCLSGDPQRTQKRVKYVSPPSPSHCPKAGTLGAGRACQPSCTALATFPANVRPQRAPHTQSCFRTCRVVSSPCQCTGMTSPFLFSGWRSPRRHLAVLLRVSFHQMGSCCHSCWARCSHPFTLERFGSRCPKVIELFPGCHTEKQPPLMWDNACHAPGVLPAHFSLSMPRTCFYKSG